MSPHVVRLLRKGSKENAMRLQRNALASKARLPFQHFPLKKLTNDHRPIKHGVLHATPPAVSRKTKISISQFAIHPERSTRDGGNKLRSLDQK